MILSIPFFYQLYINSDMKTKKGNVTVNAKSSICTDTQFFTICQILPVLVAVLMTLPRR